MCKTGMAVDAVTPKTKTQKSSGKTSSRASSSSSKRPSKSFNTSSENDSTYHPSLSSSSNFYFTTFDDSSASQTSSNRTSLSSLSNLRHHLPENPHIYDYSELRYATQNFHSSRFCASSSAAWRCSLRGRDVIIFQRRLRRAVDNSRLSKLMSVICTSHHNSIVKLLGVSISGNHIYLVYDFISGANLSDCLRSRVNPDFTPLSTWISRMQVATDLAHGLDYIHNFTRAPNSSRGFVHNRIRSSSIIVTEPSHRTKICHFGTSELCGEAVEEELFDELPEPENASTMNPRFRRKNSNAMKFEGVRGYMSPEYRSRGVGTQKADVYAFGVVLLELLSGQEPVKFVVENGRSRSVSVIDTAREAVSSGDDGGDGEGSYSRSRVWRWMDRRLRESYPMEVAEKMVRLGLECVEDDPDIRPDMGRVTGLVSKMYLESTRWADKFALPEDISVSMAPR